MQWLSHYWWIILIILIGMFINGIKALSRINYYKSLTRESKLPPHRDNNAAWDKEEDEKWEKSNNENSDKK
ncbi:MAG: YpfN family protein [Enterobacteriaceae bacterium]|jgi:sortase (surface protein transpeptidase)|nr:YpfN family protein [Enterobacteriaceae bacterium]